MKKKFGLIVVLLSSVLAATLVLGAAAYWGQPREVYVSYRFKATLVDPVVTTTINPPYVIVDGYRPPAGILSCNLTINNKTYVYPQDFSYQETFHVEANQVTGKSIMQVTTTFIFNMPGHPVLTEYLTQQATRVGLDSTVDDSVFYLTGTKAFNKVDGGGFTESYGVNGVDYAIHIGLIKGWPF
jgi:hypothetical protein